MAYQQFVGSFLTEPEVDAEPRQPDAVETFLMTVVEVPDLGAIETPAPQAPVVSATSMQHLAVNDEASAGWEAVRDYVVASIASRHGPFPRNPVTEASIFRSFCSRWGDRSMRIARTAFDVHAGMWSGAPIGVNRFCLASDQFFAQAIASKFDAN